MKYFIMFWYNNITRMYIFWGIPSFVIGIIVRNSSISEYTNIITISSYVFLLSMIIVSGDTESHIRKIRNAKESLRPWIMRQKNEEKI